MALKLRTPGSKPAAKKSTTKKSTTNTTRAKAKPASKPAAKRTTTSTRAKAKTNGGSSTRRSSLWAGTEKQLDTWINKLSKAGSNLRKAQVVHTTAIDDVNEVALDALEAGVPMKVVHEETGVSRQWLYKMSSSNSRNNGSTPDREPRTLDPELRKASAPRNTKTTRKPAQKAKAKVGSQAKAGRARQAAKKPAVRRSGAKGGKKLAIRR
jgi:hypothetical protein